eukprot:CAMPEP_0197045488 /NCGR_PEP_ID=MMETSP1384-20130603/21340_1 /TAXON_ID=29189 /ORGANISM="Ammonia sp." /LENGTH=297 /DNA_ID=CAMNT_0042477111 /DNA_START=169 /DNA_END=1062 /DNA_ORIENTATION=+
MCDQISFLPLIEGKKIERTQATYYTSDLYTKPLIPEHILGQTSYTRIERGQIQYPQNRWTAFDGWYLTNHWIHRMNDKYIYGLFGWARNGLHDTTIDDQPTPDSYMCRVRQYDDDIPGQVAGAVCVGMQFGLLGGREHTANHAREAGIFQTSTMPNNRWLPLHKANFAFKARIYYTCMMQSSVFLAAFALTDGCLSQLRQRDDLWNSLWGGVASGATLAVYYKKPFNTVFAGVCFGMYMAWFRYYVVPDGTPKTCLDFHRPGYGIFGGLPMWIANEEPNPDTWWHHWYDKKYLIWSP